MKRNGFTLVELLAVIVILGIILTLAVPKVMQIMTDKKQTLYEDIMSEIERLASSYVVDHPELLNTDNFTITLNTLCTNNYLECPIIDPRDNSEMNGNIVVYKNSKGTYEYAYGNNSTTTISNTTTANDNILSVNKVTITGKSEQINTTKSNNLFDSSAIDKYPKILSGINYIRSENNIKLACTEEGTGRQVYYKMPFANTNLIIGNQYTLSAKTDADLTKYNTVMFLLFIGSDNKTVTGGEIARYFRSGTQTTFTVPANTTQMWVIFRMSQNTTVEVGTSISFYDIQLESGTSATAYTPFIPDSPSPEYPSPISSVGTYNSTTNKYDVTLVNGKENLITNGYGELKNNTNFSGFTYTNDQVEDATNSFKRSGTGSVTLTSNEFIPVDTNKRYKLSIDVKNNGTAAKYYAGIIEYDIDKNRIRAYDVMYINNTLTYLTRELKNGDTVVYLNNVSNFMQTTATHQLGLIFWNYKDSTGYQYPELTYSRNVWLNLYTFNNVNKTNNTITLNTAWNNGTFPVGTKVSQSNSGAGYNYSLIDNSVLTSNWQTKTNTIQGICDTLCKNSFREGVKYIRFFTINNYNGTPGINTVTYYKNINISEYDQTKYTFSLNAPLRSLPDGTADKLIIDNVNKRAYVERNVGIYTFNGTENWSGPARNGTYKSWSMQSQAINGYNNVNREVIAISNMLQPISYYSNISTTLSSLSIHDNGLGSIIFTLNDNDTILTSSSTASEINIAFQKLLRDKFNAGIPVTVQYKLASTAVEELPYQEIQAINGKFDLTIGGSVQPNISVEGINKG